MLKNEIASVILAHAQTATDAGLSVTASLRSEVRCLMFDEGADIGQVNGSLSPEAAKTIAEHTLINGKQYDCQICGKNFTAPDVYRCICGLRVCKYCANDHESGW